MKTTKLLTPILSLAFVWAGCHGQSGNPTAPSPSSDLARFAGDKKGGGGDSPVYTYRHYGDMGETPSPGHAIGIQSGDVEMGICCGVNNGVEQLVLKGAFLADNFPGDATRCFGNGDLAVDFAGWIRDGRRGVTADYYFEALGTDGSTAFSYALTLTVASISGTFPPTSGGSATIEWASGELNTEGSGKGKKGGNAGSACVGDISFTQSTGVTVTEAS